MEERGTVFVCLNVLYSTVLYWSMENYLVGKSGYKFSTWSSLSVWCSSKLAHLSFTSMHSGFRFLSVSSQTFPVLYPPPLLSRWNLVGFAGTSFIYSSPKCTTLSRRITMRLPMVHSFMLVAYPVTIAQFLIPHFTGNIFSIAICEQKEPC